jgi:hypothetical protein
MAIRYQVLYNVFYEGHGVRQMKTPTVEADNGQSQPDYNENAVCTESIERYMNENFGPGAWVYDDQHDAFIAVDRGYRGRGTRFIAVRRDLTENVKTLLPHQLH